MLCFYAEDVRKIVKKNKQYWQFYICFPIFLLSTITFWIILFYKFLFPSSRIIGFFKSKIFYILFL